MVGVMVIFTNFDHGFTNGRSRGFPPLIIMLVPYCARYSFALMYKVRHEQARHNNTVATAAENILLFFGSPLAPIYSSRCALAITVRGSRCALAAKLILKLRTSTYAVMQSAPHIITITLIRVYTCANSAVANL